MAVPRTARSALFAIDVRLLETLNAAQALAKESPTRELSLAITKLQEARHWLGDVSR